MQKVATTCKFIYELFNLRIVIPASLFLYLMAYFPHFLIGGFTFWIGGTTFLGCALMSDPLRSHVLRFVIQVGTESIPRATAGAFIPSRPPTPPPTENN